MVMTPDELRSTLRGAIGFPVTPFATDHSLDLDALRKNLRVMLPHPLAAVVAAGGTGELYSLTPEEHLDVVRTTVEQAAGAVPVIAGVGFNVPLAVQLAKQAARAGASGILAFPPYFPLADDEGVLGYYQAICDATPLGVLIYSRDWFHPGPALVERLTRNRTLLAWKEGQADIRRLQMIQRLVGDRLHWIGGAGDDMVPAYYATGIRTYTSSISNVSSKLAGTLHELAAAGDAARLQPLLSDLVVPLYALRARRRGYEVTVMKELMTMLGLAGGSVRPPLPPLAPADMDALRALAPAWRAHL
jgi:5-dehydro-4-deoxyglucarate dehydratase